MSRGPVGGAKPPRLLLVKVKNVPVEEVIGLMAFISALIATRHAELLPITTVLDSVFVSALVHRVNPPRVLSRQDLPVSRFVTALVAGGTLLCCLGEAGEIILRFLIWCIILIGSIIPAVWETSHSGLFGEEGDC